MSEGLSDYLNASGAYGSNLDTIKNYADAANDKFFDNWNDQVAQYKAKGQEIAGIAGGEIGVYMPARKIIKGAYSKYKQMKKKQNDAEDEQEDGEGEGGGDTANAETAAGEGGDELPAATAENLAPEGAGLADATPETLSSLGSSGETSMSFAQQFTQAPEPSSMGEGNPSGYEPPEEPAELPEGVGQQGGELGNVATAGEEAGVAGTEGLSEGGSAIATTAATTAAEVGGETTLGIVAGAAAEAVPIVGGLVALGIGLYELFHHHKKPAAPPPPSSVATKGEMVLPSFDSVVDTPASAAAF